MWEHLKATREARRGAGVDPASDRLMHHLAEMERYQGLFLREAAHDLRNPLTAIRGHVQLVRRRLRRASSDGSALPIDRISDSLAAIELALERAADLVELLLERERSDTESERPLPKGEAMTGEAPPGEPANQAWSEPDKSTDG